MSEERMPALRNELVEFIDRIKGLDPERMSRALDQFERVMMWRAEAEYNEAMARAQRKFRAVRVDKDNPLYRSKYPSYGALMDACEDALQDEGIVVSFGFAPTEKPNRMRMSLTLSKGMFSKREEHDWPITLEGPRGGRPALTEIQAEGSAITYARRYMLQAALNLRPDSGTEDDGNSGRRPNIPDQEAVDILAQFAALGVTERQLQAHGYTRRELRDILAQVKGGAKTTEFFPATPARGNAGLKRRLAKQQAEAPDGRPNVAEPADGGVTPGADLPDDPIELVLERHFDELSSDLSWPELERRTMAIIGNADLADVKATRAGLEEHAVKSGSPIVYARLVSALNEREKALKS